MTSKQTGRSPTLADHTNIGVVQSRCQLSATTVMHNGMCAKDWKQCQPLYAGSVLWTDKVPMLPVDDHWAHFVPSKVYHGTNGLFNGHLWKSIQTIVIHILNIIIVTIYHFLLSNINQVTQINIPSSKRFFYRNNLLPEFHWEISVKQMYKCWWMHWESSKRDLQKESINWQT